MNRNGYVHGSDLLVGIMEEDGFKALGHCKTCTISNKSETKSRATKEQSNSGKWDEKVVSKNSVSITAEGFVYYSEGVKTGCYDKLADAWMNGKSLTVRYAYRDEETTDYCEGKFIITSLEETGPADEDLTYTLTLENSGEITKKASQA